MTTTTVDPTAVRPFDVESVRHDFPNLATEVRGRKLVYLDSAATTHKTLSVIDAVDLFYREQNSNVHRGVHRLSQLATDLYEDARKRIAKFIGAETGEIVFTRGTTESINLVAQTWARANLKPGDEVLITEMEHHSNIVPWQLLRDQTGVTLRHIGITDSGELRMDELDAALAGGRVKLVSVVHLSNALGTINPVEEIIAKAKTAGARVLIDGAQWVAHGKTDVKALDADWYVFSGHKLFGPTGIGVLWGKRELLEAMPPYQGGGDMIASVTMTKSEWNKVPHKFEAGTPNIAGAIGLGAAVDYVSQFDLDEVAAHERDVLDYGTQLLSQMPQIKLYGTAAHKGAVLSFTIKGAHPHDIGQILDGEGVAIRAGHHCCQPIMDRYDVSATARASLAMYNTRAEIDALAAAIRKVLEYFC